MEKFFEDKKVQELLKKAMEDRKLNGHIEPTKNHEIFEKAKLLISRLKKDFGGKVVIYDGETTSSEICWETSHFVIFQKDEETCQLFKEVMEIATLDVSYLRDEVFKLCIVIPNTHRKKSVQ